MADSMGGKTREYDLIVIGGRAAEITGAGTFDAVAGYFERQGLNVVAVHEAVSWLAELNGRQARVMTLRFFGGMTVAAVAAALGVLVMTVEQDWRLVRAWLAGQLGGRDG